jgi:glycosyltransferase involved in cell wall biosynthesis
MRVLMLGWEYPPLVTGGLATATEGLINGILALGHQVTLVLPYYPFRVRKDGLTIVSPERPVGIDALEDSNLSQSLTGAHAEALRNVVEGNLVDWKSHYEYRLMGEWAGGGADTLQEGDISAKLGLREMEVRSSQLAASVPSPLFHTMEERAFVLGVLASQLVESQSFDVVHVHDWMTFPALDVIKSRCAVPVVAHVHSTEYDRSGESGNQQIIDIERRGLSLSDHIITVSRYTKAILMRRFGVPESKIEVAYNASNEQHVNGSNCGGMNDSCSERSAVVTFVGRITFQKGPAYFVHAAELVLKTNPKVCFRVVGTGDLLASMKQLVWELGIDKSFVFDGFLDARQVQEVLAESDVFVMPSVSEPFGIVALEAVQQNIPVIISKQSGVSEVLPNALKVDFWDTELLADRILSLIKYHKVRHELVENSQKDLVRRTWHQAALRCQEAYRRAVEVATAK